MDSEELFSDSLEDVELEVEVGVEVEEDVSIHLAKIMLSTVEGPLFITIFLLFVTIIKAVYYKSETLQSFVPESCILIFCGLLLGFLFFLVWPEGVEKTKLTTTVLFQIILPPIMLEAAYGLHDRMFFENIGSILLFAVLGTLLAFVTIGLAGWGIAASGAMGSMELDLLPSLLFSSFIVAVDPVAVLAIFQDIGVDRRLYLLVFGESLLNDGVTVVLYTVMKELCAMSTIDIGDVFLGIATFFTVVFGGLVIGIFIGAMSAFLLRFMSHVRVMEICILLMCAYLSYILAMLFDWSGIISIVACGLIQVQYGFPNMHEKSRTAAKYVAKMLSLLFESLIFMYLGLEVMTNLFGTTEWNTGFALWELFFCVFSRFCITFTLAFFLNMSNRLKKISFMEQIIISYGGLRGAIAFALVTTIDDNLLNKLGVQRGTFVSATLFIILFTTVLMGLLTKPLVKLLEIRLEPEKFPSLLEEFQCHLEDHLKYGLETITGRTGRGYWRQVLFTVDDYLVKPLLQRHPETRSQKMVKRFEKVADKLNSAGVLNSPTATYSNMSVTLRSNGRLPDYGEFQEANELVLADDTSRDVSSVGVLVDSAATESSSYVDLSGLASFDARKRSRDFTKLHALMHEHAPSGVLRQRLRRSCVEDDAPYALELKKRRRLMYTLYNMQKKTLRRKQPQPSFVTGSSARPTTAMQRLARQVTYSGTLKQDGGSQAPQQYHSLPRLVKSQANLVTVERSLTLDKTTKRRNAVIRSPSEAERPAVVNFFIAEPTKQSTYSSARNVETIEEETAHEEPRKAVSVKSSSSDCVAPHPQDTTVVFHGPDLDPPVATDSVSQLSDKSNVTN